MRATNTKAAVKKTPRPKKEPEAEVPLLPHPEVSTAVATVPKASVATPAPGAVSKWASYKEEAGSDFDQQDMAIPRIKLAQGTSPCVIKSRPEYIKGAHPGDFIFTMDNSVVNREKGFLFIPCAYRREYVEWTPKRTPAAFHGTDDSILLKCTPNDKGNQLLPSGNEVVMSGAWYGMASQDEGKSWMPAVFGLNKSQFKVSKKLASNIQMFRETDASGRLRAFPMFWRAFRFTSEETSGELGAWLLWAFASEARALDLGGEKLLDECSAFRESVVGGAVHAAPEKDIDE
jgi:hypothetical protein